MLRFLAGDQAAGVLIVRSTTVQNHRAVSLTRSTGPRNQLMELTLRTNHSSPESFAIIRKAIIATNSY